AVLCAVLLGASSEARAQQLAAGSAANVSEPAYCIAQIDYHGLVRTELFGVERELDSVGVKVGRAVSPARVEEGIQRLQNLGIFRQVEYALFKVDAPEVKGAPPQECAELDWVRLSVQIDEKWTALPIFSYTRGGGTY